MERLGRQMVAEELLGLVAIGLGGSLLGLVNFRIAPGMPVASGKVLDVIGAEMLMERWH